jgi:hypothetical protein
VSTADHKHGRWILPLVIGGLIGFTYLFVNALPPGTTDPTDNGDTAATTTVAGGDGTAAPTTTQPAASIAFLTAIDDFAGRGAGFAEEAQTINDDWDNGTAEFAATRDAMTDLQTRTGTLATEIAATEVPPEAAEAWTTVVTAAEEMSTQSGAMLQGFVGSEGSEDRLNALAAYTTAAADLATGLDLSRTAVGG